MSSTRAGSKAAETNRFDFDDGDVRILVTVGDKRVTGKVSSHALSFASIVWKKSLFPPWHTETSPVEQIDFREDDSDALLVLLNIAHLQFKKVPSTLSYRCLLLVAILCDKYDCAKLTRPWWDTWFAKEATESLEEGQQHWLFIAWVFGRITVFETLAANLVLGVQKPVITGAHYYGRYALRAPEPIPPWATMPPGIMESIQAARCTTTEKLLDIPYKELERYTSAKATPCCQRGAPGCDAIIYGSISLALHRLGLWPRAPSDKITLKFSVSTLAEHVKSIQILEYDKSRYGSPEHSKCSKRDFTADVDNILSSIPSPVQDSHRNHMQKQI